VIPALGRICARKPNGQTEAAYSEQIQLERLHQRTPWI
jgi:hypothetical protein